MWARRLLVFAGALVVGTSPGHAGPSTIVGVVRRVNHDSADAPIPVVFARLHFAPPEDK